MSNGEEINPLQEILDAILTVPTIIASKQLLECTDSMIDLGRWLARPSDCRDVLARMEEVCNNRAATVVIATVLNQIVHEEASTVEGAEAIANKDSRSDRFLRAYAMRFGLSDEDCVRLVAMLLLIGACAARAVDEEKRLASMA